jgi:hypothetical protein
VELLEIVNQTVILFNYVLFIWFNFWCLTSLFLSFLKDDAPRPGQPGQGPPPAVAGGAPVRT